MVIFGVLVSRGFLTPSGILGGKKSPGVKYPRDTGAIRVRKEQPRDDPEHSKSSLNQKNNEIHRVKQIAHS